MSFGRKSKKAFKSPEEKARDKLIAAISEDTVTELESANLEALDKRIADANAIIANTKVELNATESYQKVVADKKLLETGYNEVKKRQNTIIKFALQLRQEKGAL